MADIQKKIAKIPNLTGVYLFKDSKNKIIYVGKAVNLYNRVTSYFSRNNDIKTVVLSKKIRDIEYIVTSNEVEALLLENNLIKENQPRYNIKLKDSKSYPMLKITNEELPRIIKCREKLNNKDEYFGPFINVKITRYLQKIFTQVLKIRSCNLKFKLPFNYTPCLNYHIGCCSAPCASYVTKDEYLEQINMARNILKGKTRETIDLLTKKMRGYSEKLEFENAGMIRDQINILKEYVASQFIDTQSNDNCDYIGYYSDFKNASISLIQERDGKIIGKESFYIKNIIDYQLILSDFLDAYYLNLTKFPNKVFLQEEINSKLLEEALNKNKNIKIIFKKPADRKEKKLIILAKDNAELYFEEKNYKIEKINVLRELKKALDLDFIPRNIEGIDIATLDGKFNTGALVSFVDGKPDYSGYRQFNIEGEGHPDDYAMMEELVARRYQRLKNEKQKMPDMILIDGGKGQVNAAKKIIDILNLNIPLYGLAKKNEYIFKPDKKGPIILSKDSNALKLLQKVRDEAHRFSNTRLRNRYSKKNLNSKLYEIEGLGKKRIDLILKKFKSVKSIMNASIEEISAIDGISKDLAERIYKYLQKKIICSCVQLNLSDGII